MLWKDSPGVLSSPRIFSSWEEKETPPLISLPVFPSYLLPTSTVVAIEVAGELLKPVVELSRIRRRQPGPLNRRPVGPTSREAAITALPTDFVLHLSHERQAAQQAAINSKNHPARRLLHIKIQLIGSAQQTRSPLAVVARTCGLAGGAEEWKERDGWRRALPAVQFRFPEGRKNGAEVVARPLAVGVSSQF